MHRIAVLSCGVFILSRLVSANFLIQDASLEGVRCPSGTVVHGMSIGVPSTTHWPDPELSHASAPVSFSVCVFCKFLLHPDQQPNEHPATASLVLQICVSQGDPNLTIQQKFDCNGYEFMRDYTKQNANLSSNFACITPNTKNPDSESEDDVIVLYEANFPPGRNSLARHNWETFDANISCKTDWSIAKSQQTFLCGLDVQLNPEIPINQNLSDPVDLELSSSKRPRMVPKVNGVCCSASYLPATGRLPQAEFQTTRIYSDGSSSDRTALIVVASLLAISIFGWLLLAAHLFCCRICPGGCQSDEAEVTSVKYNDAAASAAAKGDNRPTSGGLTAAPVMPSYLIHHLSKSSKTRQVVVSHTSSSSSSAAATGANGDIITVAGN